MDEDDAEVIDLYPKKRLIPVFGWDDKRGFTLEFGEDLSHLAPKEDNNDATDA